MWPPAFRRRFQALGNTEDGTPHHDDMKGRYHTMAARKDGKGYDVAKLWAAEHQAITEGRAIFHAPRANSKTGSIPAWNILPGCTCSGAARAHCLKEGCYAVKNAFCHGYDMNKNNVLRAWAENTALVKTDLPAFITDMHSYLKKARPRFFRIHAAGDFFSVDYARAWYEIARRFPETTFLAFTKQWDVVRAVPFHTLPNFSLVLSGWTGCPIPEDLRAFYPCAWCDDGQEDRIPSDAIECPGSCESCGLCWILKQTGKDTFFHKH